MRIPCLALAVPAFAMAFAIAACTNDSSAVIPVGSGSIAGGGNYGGSTGVASGSSSGGGTTESPPADAGSTSNAPSPGTGGDDANAPRPEPEGGPVTEPDAGSSSGGFGVDGQVPVVDSGVPSTNGPLGSCGNPACGSDGNECGCQATDSQGNTVQLGCQAGGECACFVNGYQATNAFDENGACGNQQATAQQFLQNCTATCN